MTPKSLIAPARLARRPVLATQADARLVDLVRAGYEPAFEAIVSRYRGALLRYVERFLSRERAEDAVQQAFVNAYEAMLRDHATLNLRPWLYRIAHNTALNALRDQALRHSELPESIDGVERPDETLERVQGLRDVLAAVKALPERQRAAIVLRELEGRSYEEIAAELGVTGGSVRQLLNRARNTLRSRASALVPVALVTRLPWMASSEPVAARVADLCGGAGGGAALAKVCATALVAGTVVGGVAVAPDDGRRGTGPERATAGERGDGAREHASGGARAADEGDDGGAPEVTAVSAARTGGRDRDDDPRGPAEEGAEQVRERRHDQDRGGPSGGNEDGAADDDDDEGTSDDRSGRGDGDISGRQRSGPGGDDDDSEPDDDDDEPDEDSSGPDDDDEPDDEDDSGPGGGQTAFTGGGSGSSGSGSGSSGSGSGGTLQHELDTTDGGSGSDSGGGEDDPVEPAELD
jgi:RNA polymerase sigma factor (sigma-70 family)